MQNLFAISGTKGSGKDEVTSMLQYCLSVPKWMQTYTCYKVFHKLIKSKFKRMAFADPLKKMLAILLNTDYEDFNNRSFKECYCVDLQTLYIYYAPGSLSDSKFNKMAKALDKDISEHSLSIRQLMQYFGTEIMQTYFGRGVWINSTLIQCKSPTIISDLRFIAEYNAVKKRNGKVIYVNRPGCTFGQHASEKEMEELLNNNRYDYVIDNNGSLKDLFDKVKKCKVEIS